MTPIVSLEEASDEFARKESLVRHFGSKQKQKGVVESVKSGSCFGHLTGMFVNCYPDGSKMSSKNSVSLRAGRR